MLRYGSFALLNLQQNLGREGSGFHNLVKTKSGSSEYSCKNRRTAVCTCPCLSVFFQEIILNGWVGQQSQIVTLVIDLTVEEIFLEAKANRD